MNRIAEVLTLALGNLRTDGWTQNIMVDGQGRHCAQGAVAYVLTGATNCWDLYDAGMNNQEFAQAMLVLDGKPVPATYTNWMESAGRVAMYNNDNDFPAVEDMFIEAIARAAATDIDTEVVQLSLDFPELTVVA